ncbi:MAG: diguanylate cyclase domain-containing protein [Massilia sp.]
MARLRYRPTRLILSTLPRTLGAELRSLLAWLVFCGLLAAAIWVWTMSVIARDKQHLRQQLHTTAAASARAYARQLEQASGQLDHIMLDQNVRWQRASGMVDLDEQRQAGLVPPTSELIVTLVDADGNPLSSTLPFKDNRTNIADRSYFLEHKQQAHLGLTIARPRIGLRLGREVILVSRRLEGRNGVFAGLVVVAIEPAYLGARLGAGALQQDDLAAAYRADGAFLAGAPQMAGTAPGAGADWRAPLVGSAGTVELGAAHYGDGKARVLAWNKVRGYPLVAAVALSEQTRLQAYGGREQQLRSSALFAMFMLLLAAAAGVAWLLWNACRKLDWAGVGAAHEQKLEQQADIDPPTGLPNGFWLMKHLPAALGQARKAGANLAVLFIGLDHVGNPDDNDGYGVGDELLHAAARRLQGVLRARDAVARLGGDEFTMILQAPGSDQQIAAVAARVIDQLRQPFAVGAGRHTVSASVGISVFPRDGEDGAALLGHADMALHEARQSGKAQYRFFHARQRGPRAGRR